MDPVTMLYYAVICALLSLAGPRLGGRAVRTAVGALVGLGAADVLPSLKATLL